MTRQSESVACDTKTSDFALTGSDKQLLLSFNLHLILFLSIFPPFSPQTIFRQIQAHIALLQLYNTIFFPSPSALQSSTLHYRLEYMHTSFPSCHPSSFSLLPSSPLTIIFHQADLISSIQLLASDVAALYLSSEKFKGMQGKQKKNSHRNLT